MLDVRRIKTIGFDLDGTLYKTTPETEHRENLSIARSILRYKPDFGTEEEAYCFVKVNYPLLKSRSRVLAQATRIEFAKEDISWIEDANIHEVLKPDSELANMLKEIKRHYSPYLLTSSPRTAALLKLEALTIDPETFSFQVFGDTPGAESKSSGIAYRFAIHCLNIPPFHHLYVGDRAKQDILPPTRLGMQTVAVWSHIPEATHSIPRIHDLSTLLKALR